MSDMVHVNGHKISITLVRFLGQIVVSIVLIIGAYFTLKAQVTDVARHAEATDKRVDGNSESIRSMDANGTRRSHEIDYGQQQQIDGIIKTLEKHDKTLGELVGKVDRIDTNLVWVMTRMKQDGRP